MSRMSVIAIAIRLAWFAASAHGETVQITIHGYERCETGQCQQVIGYASGVTIGQLPDGTDAVLTAGHSYYGLSQPQTTVAWFGNQRLPARVVAIGSSVDAAVLSVRFPRRPKCYPLNESLVAGDFVKSLGFADGDQPETRQGTWNGRTVPGAFPREGESGGPVFSGDGIGGLIVGYDRGGAGMVIETCTRIRSWMLSVGCYPVCPPVIQAPPVRPVQVAPGSLPPIAQPPSVVAAGCDCSTQFVELKAALAAERQRNQSQAGLIVELEGRIKAVEDAEIAVQIKSNGKVIDEDTYPRTGPIVFDFAPVVPPTK